MAYVITQNCCKDASCVPVCPVDCIRPVGSSVEMLGTEMLYIDPEACIDCGACMEECPVDAIHYEDDLTPNLEKFKEINAAYFQHHPLEPDTSTPRTKPPKVEDGTLRVAIVGAGPAACYAATDLLAVDGVEVNLFEKLPTPYGLIRSGVAPDHQHTKAITTVFERALTNKRLACYLNVEVGSTLTHADLMTHHHAVIYAVGAAESRMLEIHGEHLPGSYAAADFVGWYNGHPDHRRHAFDLTAERAVIVGNGNVALDVARMLLMSPDELARTDIAEHALNTLTNSAIREVEILARRGLSDAAFSLGEFLALGHLPDVDVVIEGADLNAADGNHIEAALKLEAARDYAMRTPTPGNKRIIFRFHTTPVEILGDTHAIGLRVIGADDAAPHDIEASLILKSIGYRGTPIPGLPFDTERGRIPNAQGRVETVGGAPTAGVYVTGWIKRGPKGVIGTNRSCAQQTVDNLFNDYASGLFNSEVPGPERLLTLLSERGLAPLDWQGWRNIDTAERTRGIAAARPRVKFVDVAEMLSAAGT